MDAAESLDAQVRRVDPDRWLASRFVADEAARADLIALYAFDHELSHVLEATHEPMMAEIRLTWWREGIEEIFAGKAPRGHPALQALAAAVRRRNLAQGPLAAMVEVRFSDVEAEPFTDAAALEAYADSLCGAPLSLALAVLGQADSAAMRPAALAWTLARLGRTPERLPQGWSNGEAQRLGVEALGLARQAAGAVPVQAFPAVAHLALVGPRLKGRRLGALEVRARLTLAVLTGAI